MFAYIMQRAVDVACPAILAAGFFAWFTQVGHMFSGRPEVRKESRRRLRNFLCVWAVVTLVFVADAGIRAAFGPWHGVFRMSPVTAMYANGRFWTGVLFKGLFGPIVAAWQWVAGLSWWRITGLWTKLPVPEVAHHTLSWGAHYFPAWLQLIYELCAFVVLGLSNRACRIR